MAKKSYSFYPGCSSQKAASSSNYQVSVDSMCQELDIELNEIPDWNCCSASIGYAGGYGHAIVIPVNMWVETVLVLLFYPLFVFSMRKLVVFPKLKRYIERTRAAAELHRDTVRRYGIIGLFVFVWFPFWMTGPVVGCAIGYLLGMSPWLTIVVVLAGTYIAMGGWALLMFDLHNRATEFGDWAPLLLISLIILFVLLGYGLNRHKQGK